VSRELLVRRAIVVVALLLSVGICSVLYFRVKAATRSKDSTFLEDASAIEPAFQRALGPGMPLLELVVEPERVSARVVLDDRGNTQRFVLDRGHGYVARGAPAAASERDDVAFALTTVPFARLPDLCAQGAATLGAPALRAVIDRPPGATAIRLRVFAEDGTVVEVPTG
jgi:hypothetical protein